MSDQRTVHVIATQHLDVAWLWTRVPYGEEVMRQCFERAIEMIEAHPDAEFVFSRSTAWSFWIVEQRYPELFEKVREYVIAGRIEACGGEWVEPDHLIPSGEALVRQSALGQWYYLDRFGKAATVCWDPDIFGHPNTMPQIIKKCGMDGFYFHRCRPLDQQDRTAHQFVWEGPDGSRILILSGQWVKQPNRAVVQRAQQELDTYGLPATHVVTGLQSDRRITMQTDWVPLPEEANVDPDLPACRWSSADDVLQQMKTYVDHLPVVRGELGFQYTGTYTSNAHNKRSNRRIETLLCSAEMIASWASCCGFRYPAQQLTQAWRDLCVNQFHDICCGCSYGEVHVEDRRLFEEVDGRAQWALTEAAAFVCDRLHAELSELPEGEQRVAVISCLAWSRTLPVSIPVDTDGPATVTDAAGRELIAQSVRSDAGGTALCVLPDELAGVGCTVLTVRPGTGARLDDAPLAGPGGLENEHLRVEIDTSTGELVSLVTKADSVEHIAHGGRGNRMELLEEDPVGLPHGPDHCWEPWNIVYTGRTLTPDIGTRVTVEETGPVRGRVRVVKRMQLRPGIPETVIVQDIVLCRDSRLVRFETKGNWHAERIMLKAAFDLPFECRTVAVEAPYGVAERGPNRDAKARSLDADSAAEEKRTSLRAAEEPDRYMQKWLDVSDGSRGLLFLNNGKYGYDADTRRVRLSLMRAPHMRPEIGDLSGLGPFEFAYAIMPHSGGWRDVDAPRLGYEFNSDPIVFAVKDGYLPGGVWRDWWDLRDRAPAAIPRTLVRCGRSSILLTVVKHAEDGDGLVLRVVESYGIEATETLEFGFAVKEAVECDMLERNAGTADCALGTARTPHVDGVSVTITCSPFEIKTLRVRLDVDEPQPSAPAGYIST